MSHPTPYRMNALADSGTLVRDGSGDSSRVDVGLRRDGSADRHRRIARAAVAGTAQAALPTHAALRQAPVLSQPAMSPVLRGGSVAPFAVRNNLRTPPIDSTLAGLQKMLGMTLSTMAWLVFLWGMAHLVIAAVHNAQGELGVGIDATVRGSKCCLGAFLLALIGVPQWLFGQRKIDRGRLSLN